MQVQSAIHFVAVLLVQVDELEQILGDCLGWTADGVLGEDGPVVVSI